MTLKEKARNKVASDVYASASAHVHIHTRTYASFMMLSIVCRDMHEYVYT